MWSGLADEQLARPRGATGWLRAAGAADAASLAHLALRRTPRASRRSVLSWRQTGQRRVLEAKSVRMVRAGVPASGAARRAAAGPHRSTARYGAGSATATRKRSSASMRRRSKRTRRPSRCPPARAAPAAPHHSSSRRSRPRPRAGSGLGHQTVLAVDGRSPGCRARRCRPPRRRSPSTRAAAGRTPRGVEVWTNTVASLNSALTSSSDGRDHVADAGLVGQLRLDPEQAQLGTRLGKRRHAARVSGRFLSGFERPESEDHVVAAPDLGPRPEVLQVDARRDQLRVEAELAQPVAVPGRDRHVAELVPVGGQHGVAACSVVGVVARLDVLNEVHRDPAQRRSPAIPAPRCSTRLRP